ncbi:MAG: oxidoreductase [Planctomycetota bacterium]|nr:MAG: oxidoreductase [Planctomycetota bacterium]
MTHQPVAIVTGAAQGIGAAIVRRLQRDGYAVAAVDCNGPKLDELCCGLPSAAAPVMPIAGDLADPAAPESVTQQATARFGRIDLLVNNAAWRETATMDEITLHSWQRTLQVCLTGPAFLARAVARHMKIAARGVIINVGSIMAQQAAGFAPAYVAAKGALESLTYDLAALYGPHGIRVVTVSPGAIDTSLSADLAPPHVSASDQLRRYAEGMAMAGRLGAPEEVASLVAWLASDEASYLTGTTITFDGGWSRHHLPTPLAAAIAEAPRS